MITYASFFSGASMIIGYARTSETYQQAKLKAQEELLRHAGCEKLFLEQDSLSEPDREQLGAAFAFVRAGDTIVTTRPDRFAVSLKDLLDIVTTFSNKGVGVRILSFCKGVVLDTRQAGADLMLAGMEAVYEFEQDLALERQCKPCRKMPQANKYKGRVPTARRKAGIVMKYRSEGMKPADIAKKANISRASVYRILSDNNTSYDL